MMTLAKINKGRKPVYTPDYFGGVFDSIFNDAYVTSHRTSVPVNISENDKTFTIEMAIPGFNKDNVSIEVEKDVLNIQGKKDEKELGENEKYTRKEFTYGEFKKSYTLPENIAVDKISATFNDGILTVSIPKTEPEKPVSIKIDVK
eukprot:Anaeramoba_ignava/a614967_58.p1 GENE.a614967_58~~a614967_58.p1  ORF type:complete len:146 (+),score=24.34 a614967_58:39-476(+)